jgi:predicted transcriptional regulator YdeE
VSEIIETYKQSVPPMRFIGKKYGDSDRVNGTFGAKWGEWFENGWFDTVKNAAAKKPHESFDEIEAPIGLMRGGENQPFEYYIGMFMPVNAYVPDGFESIDFPESNLGVCWIYGAEHEIYFQESRCSDKLQEEGFEFVGDWCFERYSSRFDPDEKGNCTLDICFFVK